MSAEPGTGTPQIDRLPWRAGEWRELIQGWFGHESHLYPLPGQFGEDWAKRDEQGTHLPFAVHAVAEGEADCEDFQAGAGEYITVERSTVGITSDWTDHYFHLATNTCESGTWPRQVLQGDLLGTATGSGSNWVHLHYEPRTGGIGTSVYHWESGIDNFCDHDDSGLPDGHDGHIGFQCAEAHDGELYASDNAGPGMKSDASLPLKSQFWIAYKDGGTNAKDCGDESPWDCYGSSVKVGGVGPWVSGHDDAGDIGWDQWFQATDGTWHGLNLPYDCKNNDQAYVIPLDFFWAWYNNAGQLGQARSNITYVQYEGWYQFFRYGALWSTGYGQSPVVLPPEYGTSNCYEPTH